MSKEDSRSYYSNQPERQLPPIREALPEHFPHRFTPSHATSSSRNPPQVTSSRTHHNMSTSPPHEITGYPGSNQRHGSYSSQTTHSPQSSHRPRDRDVQRPAEPSSHLYGVYSHTSGGQLVPRRLSSEDDYRQRPLKADPGSSRRRYHCEQCESSFDRPSALETHLRSHSKEKPFECRIHGCDRKFTAAGNRSRHEKTHSAASAFEDEQSGQSGSSTYYHGRHYDQHHHESSRRK